MKEGAKQVILEQLKNLLSRIRRKYQNPNIIVYGDFNTNQNWSIKKIEIITQLSWAKSNKVLITREQTRKDKWLKSTLDYFLASGKIENIHTVEKGDSDHIPMIAKIQLNRANGGKQKDYIYWTEHTTSEERLDKLINSSWPENTEQSINLFKKKLVIRPVIKLQNKANDIINENTNWIDKNIKLSDLRRKDFIEYVSYLNMNNKEDKKRFFKILNSIIKYKVKGRLVRGITSEDKILYGKWRDAHVKSHFELLFQSDQHKPINYDNGIFNYYWDIIRAIKTLSRSNAAGTDGIPSKIYRQSLDSPIISKLTEACKEWIRNSEIPDYLMEGRLVLISKDKTDIPKIDDTRPITILPAITKIFETSILHNLEQVTTNPAFSKNQRGFTKGMSTSDNIKDVIKLARELRDYKIKNDTPALVFFDFCKAYDSVPREIMLTKLIKMNAPGNIVKLIGNMLRKFRLKIGKETIHTKIGLVQGSVLSPVLFNIFINDLLIIYEICGIEVRAYADDIVWICSSINQIQKAVCIMKEWWTQNEMKINEKKSGILRILKRNGKVGYIENTLNIPEVKEYKYLGIILNQSIRLTNHQKLIRSKVQALKKRIWLLRPSLTNMRARLILYKTIIHPQLTYAWEALFNNHPLNEKILKSALYQWIKSLVCIKANVSSEKLFKVLHLNMDEKPKSTTIKRNILENLTVKVIKLRVDWLFSRRTERSCDCNHMINSMIIVMTWAKLNKWRTHWTAKFKELNMSMKHSLFYLTSMNENLSEINPLKIAEWINKCVDELTEWYFQK